MPFALKVLVIVQSQDNIDNMYCQNYIGVQNCNKNSAVNAWC